MMNFEHKIKNIYQNLEKKGLVKPLDQYGDYGHHFITRKHEYNMNNLARNDFAKNNLARNDFSNDGSTNKCPDNNQDIIDFSNMSKYFVE